MTDKNCPIGVFDSGLGGLSVLKRLVSDMPGEDFIYYGDSANAPYGIKKTAEVERLSLNVADKLYKMSVKAIVVACNTATAAAIIPIREKYADIPVIGMEPALKPAVLSDKHPGVIVMATPVTLHEEKFARLYGEYEKDADITVLPCPGLVEFVERGETDSPELYAYLSERLLPHMNGTNAIVLGCTHYPFVAGAIRKVVGPTVKIFDGSVGTSRETKRRLQRVNMLSGRETGGVCEYISSAPSRENELLYRQLMAVKIPC